MKNILTLVLAVAATTATAQSRERPQDQTLRAYCEGQGVNQHFVMAKQGEKRAQYCYGYAVTGINVDASEAFSWYLKSAEAGLPDAQAMVASGYLFGRGVAANGVSAARWYARAAENGHIESMNYYARMLRKGEVVAKNEALAFQWDQKAAIAGLTDAQQELARDYFRGRGIARDPVKGREWLVKAAENGDVSAQSELSIRYFTGEEFELNIEKATLWATRAADQNNPVGQSILVRILNGSKSEKNRIDAYMWCYIYANNKHGSGRLSVMDKLEMQLTQSQRDIAITNARERIKIIAENDWVKKTIPRPIQMRM